MNTNRIHQIRTATFTTVVAFIACASTASPAFAGETHGDGEGGSGTNSCLAVRRADHGPRRPDAGSVRPGAPGRRPPHSHGDLNPVTSAVPDNKSGDHAIRVADEAVAAAQRSRSPAALALSYSSRGMIIIDTDPEPAERDIEDAWDNANAARASDPVTVRPRPRRCSR